MSNDAAILVREINELIGIANAPVWEVAFIEAMNTRLASADPFTPAMQAMIHELWEKHV